MKKNIFILLFVSLFVSCTNVEFCAQEHPHKDKLVVKLNWKNLNQVKSRPSSFCLYMWKNGVYVPQQISVNCDDELVLDLPEVGSYQMILMSELKKCSFKDNATYANAKVRSLTETIEGSSVSGFTSPGDLYLIPLGDIDIKNNDALIMNATVVQGVRPISVEISVLNPGFYIDEFTGTLSGVAEALLIAKNQPDDVSNAEMSIPFTMSASTLNAKFSSFGLANEGNVAQILSFYINYKYGSAQKVSIDITKYIKEFESANPNKDIPLKIVADAQFYAHATGPVFKITAMSVDGKVVIRGGDI